MRGCKVSEKTTEIKLYPWPPLQSGSCLTSETLKNVSLRTQTKNLGVLLATSKGKFETITSDFLACWGFDSFQRRRPNVPPSSVIVFSSLLFYVRLGHKPSQAFNQTKWLKGRKGRREGGREGGREREEGRKGKRKEGEREGGRKKEKERKEGRKERRERKRRRKEGRGGEEGGRKRKLKEGRERERRGRKEGMERKRNEGRGREGKGREGREEERKGGRKRERGRKEGRKGKGREGEEKRERGREGGRLEAFKKRLDNHWSEMVEGFLPKQGGLD
ncbi:Octapeptide-repeat protein T2, partial [Ophiophagus hannah]